MQDLTFTHQFQSGQTAVVVFHRTAGKKPRVTSTFKAQEATAAERAEYLQWRTQIVAVAMSVLTPGEVLSASI